MHDFFSPNGSTEIPALQPISLAEVTVTGRFRDKGWV